MFFENQPVMGLHLNCIMSGTEIHQPVNGTSEHEGVLLQLPYPDERLKPDSEATPEVIINHARELQ